MHWFTHWKMACPSSEPLTWPLEEAGVLCHFSCTHFPVIPDTLAFFLSGFMCSNPFLAQLVFFIFSPLPSLPPLSSFPPPFSCLLLFLTFFLLSPSLSFYLEVSLLEGRFC